MTITLGRITFFTYLYTTQLYAHIPKYINITQQGILFFLTPQIY